MGGMEREGRAGREGLSLAVRAEGVGTSHHSRAADIRGALLQPKSPEESFAQGARGRRHVARAHLPDAFLPVFLSDGRSQEGLGAGHRACSHPPSLGTPRRASPGTCTHTDAQTHPFGGKPPVWGSSKGERCLPAAQGCLETTAW